MRRLWLAAQALLAGVVLYFVGRALARDWSAIRAASATISVDPLAIVASAGITLATYAMLITAWRAVLLGWGERLAYGPAARIWCVSNLARYVPGRIWQIAGMAAMAQRAGVSPWAATGSAVVVQLLAIATGALVTGVAAPQAGRPALIAVAGTVAAGLAATLAWNPATRWLTAALRKLTGRDLALRPVAPGPLLLAAGVTTLAWVGYGLALRLLVQGVGAPSLSVSAAVGAFAASYLVGLLVVFTPGGLGAREGAIYVLLAGPLGPPAALVVTLGSRVLMTATELVAAAVTLPLGVAVADGSRARP